MGKASKLKRIRRIANQLPKLQTHQRIGSAVDGIDLIKQGVNIVQGKEVLPAKTYRKVETIPVQLNHNKVMKRIYNKHGAQGVAGYIKQVTNFAKQQQAK